MSMGEMQQLFALVQEIDQMLGSIEGKMAVLEKDAPHTAETLFTLTETLRIFWRLSHILDRMGLPKNVTQAIRVLTTLAHTAVMANTAVNLLMIGTGIGTIKGLIGIGALIASAPSMASSLEGY